MIHFCKSLYVALGAILLVIVSCSKEISDNTDATLEKHTCEMKLVGSLVNYDNAIVKSGSDTSVWADSSIIYLKMDSPIGNTLGEAVYNAEKDIWTISYYGSLYDGVPTSCSALYLEDMISVENSLFTMDERTVIYEDLEGVYIFDGGDLVVTANLKPKTGRIRFAGTAGSVLKIYGVTRYETYDLGTDIYKTSSFPFKLTVGEDGYTPYFYGHFTDKEEPNIKVWIDAKEAYTRFCSNDIFNAGQSGKMTVPRYDSHSGWADGLYFNVNGAQFKMVAVEGGTFIMGDSSPDDEYQVTLTGYCIAETEMTGQLNDGIYSSSSPSSSLKPSFVRWSSVSALLNVLRQFTFAEFNLPSEAQWEFAAKGGCKSKGYRYSGSNSIDDVAWYKDNSDDLYHDVKTKQPNELGLYDMSGNAVELVLDNYNEYPDTSVVDPVLTDSSNRRVIRGGSIRCEASKCTNIYRQNNSTLNNLGQVVYPDYSGNIRLVLNWN